MHIYRYSKVSRGNKIGRKKSHPEHHKNMDKHNMMILIRRFKFYFLDLLKIYIFYFGI